MEAASNVYTNDDERKRSRIIDSHPVSVVAPVVPSLGLVLDFARPDQPNKFPLHDNYEVFSKANQEIANVTILFIYVMPSKICNQDSEIFEHCEDLGSSTLQIKSISSFLKAPTYFSKNKKVVSIARHVTDKKKFVMKRVTILTQGYNILQTILSQHPMSTSSFCRNNLFKS